jgi:hypothetical protein
VQDFRIHITGTLRRAEFQDAKTFQEIRSLVIEPASICFYTSEAVLRNRNGTAFAGALLIRSRFTISSEGTRYNTEKFLLFWEMDIGLETRSQNSA